MGEGVEQRGGGHGCEEVHAAERPQAVPAEEMDSGAHLFLALSEQEAEQGLREAAGKRRSLYLRGYEPPDDQEIGSLMRLFGQFLDGVLGSSPPEIATWHTKIAYMEDAPSTSCLLP